MRIILTTFCLLLTTSCISPRVEVRHLIGNVYRVECYNNLNACLKMVKNVGTSCKVLTQKATKQQIVSYREAQCSSNYTVRYAGRRPEGCEVTNNKATYIQKDIFTYTTYNLLVGCEND